VRTRELAKTASAGKTGLAVRRDEYLRHMDGLVWGADPRGGYFEGDIFYHPELAFAITYPAGWKRQNTHAAVIAATEDQQAALQLTMASEAADLSPADYVAKLAGSRKIAGAQGTPGTIGGFAAWTGRVAVAGEGGTERVLAAAFIRRGPGRMFQILGVSAQPGDARFEQVLTSARSFRALEDPARLKPTPARLKLVKAARSGSFATVVEGFGTQALDAEATSLINNRLAGDVLSAGEPVKIVTPSRLR
jgi:predicted Zn-dependent protease